LDKTPFIPTARQGSPKLPAGGYLSMNSAAWQPLRSAGTGICAPKGKALVPVPRMAVGLARGGWGEHLLDLNSIRQIKAENIP
jgi:hypothetical protein